MDLQLKSIGEQRLDHSLEIWSLAVKELQHRVRGGTFGDDSLDREQILSNPIRPPNKEVVLLRIRAVSAISPRNQHIHSGRGRKTSRVDLGTPASTYSNTSKWSPCSW